MGIPKLLYLGRAARWKSLDLTFCNEDLPGLGTVDRAILAMISRDRGFGVVWRFQGV
ncbi:MAG: hypothetical protein LVS60_15010 [Nodosilinea sp. LVE1205-7]